MNKHAKYTRIAIGLAIAGATASQAKISAGAVIEEVIVTAQKRAHSAQLTPVAMTATTGEDLREAGVVDATQLGNIAPSLTSTMGNGQLQLSMRGVGNEVVLSGIGESGVAFHLNGIYLGNNVTPAMGFFDVERVEVMRGPQGTLWGRNSTGGAVNVIQKRPTEQFEAAIDIDYGSYDTLNFEGAVSGSVRDNTQARLAVNYRRSDGYIENKSPGGNDLGNDDSVSARGSINFDLDSWGAWLVATGYGKRDAEAYAYRQEGTAFPRGSANPLTGTPGNLSYAEVAFGEAAPRGKFETFSTFDGAKDKVEHYYITSDLTLDFDNFSLALLTDYREYDRDNAVDTDFTATSIEDYTVTYEDSGDELSQEVRLSSNGGGDLDWVVGAYYYQQKLDTRTLPQIGPFPGVPDVVFGLPDYPRWGVDLGGQLDIESVATFGQTTYHLTQDWSMTLGLRYSWDDKSVDEYNNLFLGNPGSEVPLSQVAARSDGDWSDWSGKLGLEYNPTDNVFLFGSIAKGYKSGGINVGSLTGEFDPESLYAYEVGLKSNLLDRRLQANVTAFFNDYQDYQLQSVEGVATIITNADADIAGIEVELGYIPVESWLLKLVASWNDSEVTGFAQSGLANPATGAPIVAGEPLPRTPEYSYRFSAQKTFAVNRGLELSGRVSYTWQDDVNFDSFGTTGGRQESYGLVDASLSLTDPSAAWTVDLYGRNLSDEFYVTSIFYHSLVVGSTAQAQIGMPRSLGIRFRKSF